MTPLLLGAAAALLVGLSKTGVPGVSLPAILLMAEAFPGAEKMSVAAILPILLLGDCFAVGYYRQHAQWKRLFHLFPYVLAGMAPGWFVLLWAEDQQFRLVLGWMVLVLLAIELGRTRLGWDDIHAQWWFTAMLGLLAGFGTMVGNAAGPVMSIFLISQGMRKEAFMGTWAWFFLIVNLSKVPLLLALELFSVDMFTPEMLWFDLCVLPVVVLGALVGRRVFRVIPQRVFDPLVLALAGAAALRMVVV